ncbi:DUF4352 domain-containing protein [Haloarcula nitratireducens]|uniref:DUF4352 domain-containing protein n=1 Tax=Haloarcula nitratireducens TaxID=2487749 RepID=A0AAW4PJJ4_9EURY|nr:DUF4352 domain-containing protein [Halomicroarcula nitratireducens]MBX0298156.1 DUF4352 domain-containing protein [Halomicroarcula nitratireducens]
MSNESQFSRRRFVALGTLAALAGCSGGEDTSNSDSDGSTTDTATTTGDGVSDTPASDDDAASEEDAGSQSATVKLGEVVEGDNLSMVARETSTTTQLGEFQEAGNGNEFVVIRLAVKNTSDSFIDFSSFWQTRLKDSENTVYDPTFGATAHPFDGGSLAPGEVSRGDVVYEVPKNAEGLNMQFDFSTFDLFSFERVVINLGQEASSISNLSQDLDVDILSPGDSASKNGVKATVHGVRTESQLGEMAQPDEGNEYVIPDIEITNNTDEALTVSTLLQMRIKTGTGLSYTADTMGSSALDQSYKQGSDIAPGEARRGELAFQVEEGVEPLYFIFDFLDLADSYKAFWELR